MFECQNLQTYGLVFRLNTLPVLHLTSRFQKTMREKALCSTNAQPARMKMWKHCSDVEKSIFCQFRKLIDFRLALCYQSLSTRLTIKHDKFSTFWPEINLLSFYCICFAYHSRKICFYSENTWRKKIIFTWKSCILEKYK